MDAIYSFKLLKHYKPFDETFFRLAKLSIFSAKQFYKTILYTDTNSAKFLENGGLEFDEVIILDSIENYKGINYAIPKIFSMIQRNSPYIHLDFDSVLIDEPKSTSPVSFPFPEPNLKDIKSHNAYDFIYTAYVKCFVEHILDKIDYSKQKMIKWDIFPNNSAMIVNNPQTISTIYTEIITEFVPDILEKLNPTAIEQQYLLSFLEHYHIKYDFRKESDIVNVIDYKYLSKKEKIFYLENIDYLHLSQYSWWPDITHEILNFFEKKLKMKSNSTSII